MPGDGAPKPALKSILKTSSRPSSATALSSRNVSSAFEEPSTQQPGLMPPIRPSSATAMSSLYGPSDFSSGRLGDGATATAQPSSRPPPLLAAQPDAVESNLAAEPVARPSCPPPLLAAEPHARPSRPPPLRVDEAAVESSMTADKLASILNFLDNVEQQVGGGSGERGGERRTALPQETGGWEEHRAMGLQSPHTYVLSSPP